ncbi:dystrophin-like [Homarus americanus]|uniref:dystrophin-like n=1 Tax=Homarus americanus TaxID=6706 RepID=UPI001C452CFA|nr:dystrophin-like [Homarus americanus]
MSGRLPNLQDLTRLLTQGRLPSPRADTTAGSGTSTHTKSGRHTGERNDCGVDALQSAQSPKRSQPSAGTSSQSTQSTSKTVMPAGDPKSGDLKEFVHEVEFQHNTLLGKMQLLRETLAKQLAPSDEREDVQKKTFAKWINSQLVKGQHPPVTDLFYDLRDGTRLLALLEVLTNKTYKREKGRMRVHHLNNVSRALNILEEHSVKLVNISNEHIVDGSAKLTLGLVWAIILHWQVQGVLKDVMSDLQQTNLEKTLLAWCRQTTKGYHGVDVRNFTTSWTDGLAFNALIHSQRPQLFDWTVLARKHPYARLENAFRLANEQLNIERLLDPEDVNSQVPDKKSIMMYVMCLFQALPHESFTMESLDVSLQSDSSFNIEGSSDDPLRAAAKARPLSTVSIGLSEYQRTLEEVLTWLLGAEDRLAAMPPIADTTEAVKDQFHDLEELMLELTSKQGGIGDVLGEGSRLMREGVMEEEEEEEVRVQMKLLNTRWEDLRVKAMDRQSRLHEKLMSLQQKQLESLKKWLTETEDRIANMSQSLKFYYILYAFVVHFPPAYSTLEDELNALGERWAHICRWAESRWATLQTLSVHWEHFEQEIEKLRQWLNEKETSLRQFESDPSTEQEHILRHASMLQVLQAEMEVQHRRHAHLQEESGKVLSYIPEGSPAHENISTDIESIQDRMDCLLSIIEAQTQRLAASGIDITKVMVPVDGSSDVVSSSTTTISHEGATVITKIITTKVTETVTGSVVKRQKLEGGSQEDFSVALHQLGGWMDSVEAQIKPKAIEDLSLDQLVQLSQQLESEMDGQKEEYYKVVSLGQSAISETSTIGESSQESERQVAIVSSRWEALMEMLVEIRTRITYLNQKKRVTTDLSDLEVHYQGFVRWFEDVRTVSENEPNAVTLQAEQCKTKIAAMESHNEDIAALKASTKTLNQKWEEESQPLVQQITAFHTKWENLMQRFLEWNETLGEMQAQAVTPTVAPLAPPPESLLKAMDASGKWLESLEAALASEYSASTLPQMQDQHIKFKDLSQKVEMERGNMAHINETCNRLSQDGHVNIMEDITKLNKQWETTTESLRLRIQNIEKVMEKQKQYNDEVSGLKSWLDEVDVFLQAEEAALGDIETLEAQLEQSNALQDDVATLQTNVSNIKTTGKHLIEEGDSELKSIIENQLDELTNRWNLVTELARAQNKSLKEALTRSQKVHDGIDKLNLWLDELEAKIPSSLPRNTPQELSHAVEIFTQLREDISLHSDELRAINNIGDELLQVDSSATHEELARRFTQLNGRWTEVVSQVDSSYKVNITASQQYEDFKKVCSEESEWLDQLQAKLERSSKDAADAEEISEALDELEIFLHSHDERRLEQIRNLAESLVSESCVAEPVQETTHSLTCRFDTLNAQASEQQSGLEGSVQEAQAWEREYVSVLDYLAQSDLILTQAINDEIQVDQVQVEAEMMTQQNVLQKMQAQVEVYHGQGKTEAALRLEDQVSHLQKKYEEIELKLRACQKPSDFDTRLNQVNYQLTGISQQVHLVSVDSGNPDGIQEQLNQCMDLYQTLSEVKAEVESVIATGRKIVKEGQSADPDGLTLQLDQLKALYNKLGGTVTEHRGILERALRHSRKIQKDSSHLEEWLSTTECELDQREATVPTKNVEGEVHFAQHAIDDLGRKKPLLTGLHESYAALTSMSDDPALLQPIKEQVDDITLTWERVSIRLANRLKNMQTEQVAKEAEMERFIIGLGEVKGWLESTEYQLLNISRLDPSDQDQLIKSVSSEIQSYKGQIENIRDTAVDLINHGVLFQARIQPELVLINQRWENIYRTVQVKSEDFEDTLSNVSQSEDDDTSSFEIGPELSDTEASNHESFEDMRRLETEDVSVREMGEEAELGSGSPDIDIGMKKRKRFAKLYEETDCEMLNEIKKTEQPLMQDVQAGEESLPEEVSRNPKSKKRALKSTSIVTADSLGKALRRKGLTTDTVEGKTWESSSSSSRSRSNRGSSSEGSIDFGSETRGAISGDWDDAPIPQDLSVQHPVADDQQAQKESLEKVQAHEMLNKVQEHEMLRFSFLSSSSIEMDNEEVFAREIEMESHEVDAMIEVTEIDSSSSDESDDLEEPSNVRISAATIYEHAVINALEGSGEKVSEKRVNQEDSFVGSSETDVTDSTVVQHIVTKEEQGADGKTETYTLILDHKLSSTETAKPCAAILGEHPSLETKQIEMNKIEIEEVTDIYSADQFPNQEINEVIPESVIVTQCKDESNVSLKTADERNTACESPMEELGETVVEVVSKQFPEEEDVQTMTKMICTSLTREDIRESPNQVICSNQSYDITVSQEHKMKENISETAQSGGENQLMTLEQELKKSPDIPLIELHSPVEPQYSTRIREEMEVFETTMESPASPSITINLVSVEVGEETLEVANMSEILTGECEEYKVVEGEQSVTCKDNDDSKYSQASVVSLDNNQSLGKAGLCESVPYLEKAEDENMEKIFEKENLGVKEGVSKKDSKRDEDEEPEVREITRKISVSSSSSSGSSFEMVEHEPEADLEEQLSSHDSYEEMDSGEKDSVTENDMEVDEGMDTIDEPDRVEEQLDPDIASVSLEVKLERHVSIDSSVSTLSEAETVIHVPIGSLSKKISETVSVKDDSQIGVKTLKSVEAQESLMRSVSEELITKTTIPEGKSQGKELSEGIPKISGAKKESGLAPIMQNVDTTIKKVDHESAVLTARLDRHSPAHGGFCKSACEASFVVMMQDDVKDDEAAKCDVIVVENTNKHPGCRVVKAGDLKKESDLRYQRETLREADVLPKTIRKEVESKTSAESSIKKEPVTGSAGAGDAVLGVNFKGEDGWTEVKIIKSSVEETPRMERRVSVDVAQVIEATEVIEEQEVTISIPDVHHGDSRDESSAASDEEMDHIYIKPSEKIFVNLLPDSGEKIEATESKDKIFLPLSSIHLEKHTTVNTEKDEVLSGMPKTSGTCSETKKSLTVSVVCDNAVDIDTKTAETSSKIEIKEVMKSMYDPDKSVCENIEVNKNRGQSQLGKEVPSYTQYELKDIGFVVIDDYSASKSGEPKEETEKESPLSSAASNSNSSSPYYDASGEMVESLGSDDVSTSMEVLHSSAEILDTPADCWSSPNDQPTQSAEEIISLESKDKSVPLRDTKCYLTPGSEHRSSRFSTISVLTDASEGEVIFSETEGEEYPYEDTTDDDLTLEEEAIKTMAEKKQSSDGSVAGGSVSEKVYASRSYIKQSTQERSRITTTTVSTTSKETQKAGQLGDDEVDSYLREVTVMADKITSVKTKVQTLPSYQDAKAKAEALEQEVALLEPDVATVISHGDTLTLTTHMVDVPRANTIRIAVNDLRTHWSALKSETEAVKLEAEQVAHEISIISGKADEIISWANDASKRLHLVNNDESQLEALENEMTSKKAELDKLNESGILLKKYKYNQIQPVLTLLNMRWTEISMQFRQYRKGSLEKKAIVSTTKVDTEKEPVIVPDFVASVNRLREGISAISRQLNANKLAGDQYENLKSQEDELKAIKQGLETLKPRVDGLEAERNATVRNITPTESEQVRRVMDKLREEWAQVNRGYTERHARWLQCSETWRTLQKTIDDFAIWLNSIEERVQVTSNQPLPDAKITQKELEKQVTLKHRPSQTLQSMSKEVTEGMNAEDGKRLQERVDSLMKRWRALLLDLAARRERIAGEDGGKDSTSSEYESLVTWVDQAQALMDAPVNVTDEASLSAHSTMVQNHVVEMMIKQNLLKKLKDSKPKSISTAQMNTLETNLNKVVKTLPDYKNMVDTKLGVIKTLVTEVEDLYKWTEEMRVKVALRNLTEEELRDSKVTLREKEALYENLDSTYWVLAQDAEGKGLTVAVALKNRMNTIESRLKVLQGQVSEAGAATPPSPTSPAFPPPDTAGDKEKVDLEKAVKLAKEEKVAMSRTEASVHATGTTVTSSVTSVIQNVIKFEESVLSTEAGLRPPSPLVSPPHHAPDSSPVLILASLDKSILQIRDWLTLMEQMTRQQTVVVGDADDIRQLTEKQKPAALDSAVSESGGTSHS